MARHWTTNLSVLAACVWLGFTVHASARTAAGLAPGAQGHDVADGSQDKSALLGAWTLNAALSDTADTRREQPNPRNNGGFGGGGGRGGGRGRGGISGGGGRQGGFGGAAPRDPDQMARRQEELRDVVTAPSHLTIVEANTMLIVTANDGRTTRLMPDDSKIKDESTSTERRTKWEHGKLVSRISGSGRDITETYSVDSSHHELLVIVRVEGGRGDDTARVFHRLYTADAR